MSGKKNVLAAVINDVSTDQRLDRTCTYLTQKNFEVTAYGRLLPSTFLIKKDYTVIHKKHWFNKGFLFYAEYNLKLLYYLLRKKKYDYVLANDLDTLPACFLACKIKKTELIFDSHEYFTETPEVQGRSFVKKFWKSLEGLLLPRLKKGYTVSPKIAQVYHELYGVHFGVVRNLPYLKKSKALDQHPVNFPTANKVVLYQGKLTKHRGLNYMIDALHYLKVIDLVIIGHGKEAQNLKNYVRKKGLKSRVHFLGRIPADQLHNYTQLADLGIVLEEPVGESFQFALPNKLFDYIHGELPIVASPLFEIKKVVEKYKVGVFISNHEPRHIAEVITNLLNNEQLLLEIKTNQKLAKEQLCWEKESKLLDQYFS